MERCTAAVACPGFFIATENHFQFRQKEAPLIIDPISRHNPLSHSQQSHTSKVSCVMAAILTASECVRAQEGDDRHTPLRVHR
jgi:hypothetical protein